MHRTTTAPCPCAGAPARLPRPCAAERSVDIRLPLDFTAFCELRHAAYRRYAYLRLADRAAAERAVRNALGDLAADWLRILSSPRPAGPAWQQLLIRIDHEARRLPPPPTAARRLYARLPAPQAEAMLLHLEGLSIPEAADLTGNEAGTLAYRLRSAQSILDARLALAPR